MRFPIVLISSSIVSSSIMSSSINSVSTHSECEMEMKGERGYRAEITEEYQNEMYESHRHFNKVVSKTFLNKTAINKRIEELKKKISAKEARARK